MGRRRGIRACRHKLEMAMVSAGIRTQEELAERMAKIENLVLPPRDTVSRAFRGIAVSPTSLARIARVLGVSAQDLQLEAGVNTDTAARADTPQPRSPSADSAPSLRFRLALHALDNPSRVLARSLAEAARLPLSMVLLNENLIEARSLPADIAHRYQADGVLTLRSLRHGRHLGLQLFLYRQGRDQLLWSIPTHEAELKTLHRELARQALPALRHACGLTPTPADPSIPLQSLDFYLQARDLLEEHLVEINLKRAQSLLRDALQDSPGFARCHAALAEALLHNSWMANERKLIEEASACTARALELAPRDVYVQCIQSWVLRRSGGAFEAVKLCRRLLQRHADHVDVLSALGNACLLAHEQEPEAEPGLLEEATECLRRACRIEPDFWRHHFELGNCLISGHAIKPALEALQKAADLRPNEASLINLGSLYLCQGLLDRAEDCYQRAHALDPEGYAANDALARIHYYRREFGQAVRFQQAALDALMQTETVGLHQMWGDLADGLRHLRRWDEALQAYRNALLIIDRDQLAGQALVMDEIYRIHYLLVMHRIDPDQIPPPEPPLQPERFRAFLDSDLYPTSYLILARIGLLLDWRELAEEACQRATAICPVYRRHPDLEALWARQTPITPRQD